MSTHKPDPTRFQVYTLRPDGKSFTIPNCDFVFKIDRNGGWRDQHGNYYNSNGEPDFEPEEEEEFDGSEYSYQQDHDQYDDYDQYAPNYDEVEDGGDEDFEDLKTIQKISKNMETLSSYPPNKSIRVYFENMPYKTPPKSVFETYSKRIAGILNIVFNLQKNLRNGTGHFIMQNSKAAESLVKLQGEKVVQRQVYFVVQTLNELIMDPIKQSELIPIWNPNIKNTGKIDVNTEKKFKAVDPQKPEIKQKQEVKKEESIKIEKPISVQVEKAEQKKEQKKVEPQFKTYKLNFQIFQTKTRFFNWIHEKNVNKDEDIRNITKKQQNKKVQITMQIRVSAIPKMNGQKYVDGKQISHVVLFKEI